MFLLGCLLWTVSSAQNTPVFDGKQMINVAKVAPWNFASRPAGWYRIAKCSSPLRGNATFELREDADHSTLRFQVGVSYNSHGASSLTITSHSYYYAPTFTKLRLLTGSTYYETYLEVYVDPHNNDGSAFNAYLVNPMANGDWALLNWENGSIPSGYNSSEFDANQLFTVANITQGNIMSVGRNGNVGIGTTTPNEKLSVNGKIRAKEIKVETANWPDYVFEEGYKVGTLEELESYIKANKHLPEMPSAKEVEANGVELGEMVKLQQKKIEELTLLLIEQNKQLQDLAEKNKELVVEKTKNLRQEERIAKLEAFMKIKK